MAQIGSQVIIATGTGEKALVVTSVVYEWWSRVSVVEHGLLPTTVQLKTLDFTICLSDFYFDFKMTRVVNLIVAMMH